MPLNIKYSIAAITRSTRDLPPAHFSLKIESYSLLSQAVLEKFESCVFEACRHKWWTLMLYLRNFLFHQINSICLVSHLFFSRRLYLYPRGKAKIIGTGHISLYLAIAETEKLPLGWEVNASFKFFLFDQIRDMYLTIQGLYSPDKYACLILLFFMILFVIYLLLGTCRFFWDN